jgi:hypothetical protein
MIAMPFRKSFAFTTNLLQNERSFQKPVLYPNYGDCVKPLFLIFPQWRIDNRQWASVQSPSRADMWNQG